MNPTQTASDLIRIAEVIRHVGLSRSEIYRRIKRGHFPQPVRLGHRTVAWTTGSIEVWKRNLTGGEAHRPSPQSPPETSGSGAGSSETSGGAPPLQQPESDTASGRSGLTKDILMSFFRKFLDRSTGPDQDSRIRLVETLLKQCGAKRVREIPEEKWPWAVEQAQRFLDEAGFQFADEPPAPASARAWKFTLAATAQASQLLARPQGDISAATIVVADDGTIRIDISLTLTPGGAGFHQR